MRARVVSSGLVIACALGASLVACVDLFHGTDFESACNVDAAACSSIDANVPDTTPPIDAGSDGPTDFCSWDGPAAHTNALHACTWLGACEGALADDAFGPCMFHATLAYDCAANPNRPVVGAAHAYWDCLARATTCAEVDRCIEPSGTIESCAEAGADYVACDQGPGTLIACAAGLTTPSGLESCVALGQTCSSSGAVGCGGSIAGCSGSTGVSCDGNHLHDCDPDGGSIDYGVDCTSFGAGSCAQANACLAIGDGGSCDPTSVVACGDGGLATGCPSGVPETLDCNALLGHDDLPTTCDPNAPGRAWDVSRACSVGACPAETCGIDGKTVTSCAHGATISVKCTDEGFTSCALVSYAGDPSPHARCTN